MDRVPHPGSPLIDFGAITACAPATDPMRMR
jgi:hypothetical protein